MTVASIGAAMVAEGILGGAGMGGAAAATNGVRNDGAGNGVRSPWLALAGFELWG